MDRFNFPTAEEEEESETIKDFSEAFIIFAKLLDPESDGTRISYTAAKRWLKHSRVMDGKNVRETDVGLSFFKFKRSTIPMDDFDSFLQELCQKKDMDFQDVKRQMSNIQDPRKQLMKQEKSGSSRMQAQERLNAHRASVLALLTSHGVKITPEKEEEEAEEKEPAEAPAEAEAAADTEKESRASIKKASISKE